MSPLDPPVIIEPKAKHQSSVIWLHGLGADGNDFEPIVPELRLPESLGIRFIFPHAPVRPVSINGGLSMRAWYDIRNVDLTRQEDEASIRQSHQFVEELIAAEVASGIPHGRIVLAGFSQGGAMTLFTGLRQSEPLAGLLALSTYLPLPEQLVNEAQELARKSPIMMMHGSFDGVIPVTTAQASRDALSKMGYSIDWKEYPMQHSLYPEQIGHISSWLQERLG